MRESCKLASGILKKCADIVKVFAFNCAIFLLQIIICFGQVGTTTDEIDKFVHEQTIRANAYPSPLRYHGFPKSVCTSVNNVACHGIPDNRPLTDGDIINVDVTVGTNNILKSIFFNSYFFFRCI